MENDFISGNINFYFQIFSRYFILLKTVLSLFHKIIQFLFIEFIFYLFSTDNPFNVIQFI